MALYRQKTTKNTYSFMFNERKWLFALSRINASGQGIIGFYILKRKQMRENYIIQFKDGASMEIQFEGG